MSSYLRTGKRKNAESRLTLLPSGQTVTITRGTSLLQALLRLGATMHHDCGGRAVCGSCHVLVHQGLRGLSKIGHKEQLRLRQITGTGKVSRLACQALIGTHDVTIELLHY